MPTVSLRDLTRLPFGDVLQRLASLAPEDLKSLELLARDQLAYRMKQRQDVSLQDWIAQIRGMVS